MKRLLIPCAAMLLYGCLRPTNCSKDKQTNCDQDKQLPKEVVADTAFVIDAKLGIRPANNANTRNALYMITKSGREVFTSIRYHDDPSYEHGYFAREGDTVLLDEKDNIIAILRHERAKQNFVKNR